MANFSFTNNGNEISIEELFILPEYQECGLGSIILEYIEKFATNYIITKIIGHIPKIDLVFERKEKVEKFFKNKNYKLTIDKEHYRGSYYHFEKEIIENRYFYS